MNEEKKERERTCESRKHYITMRKRKLKVVGKLGADTIKNEIKEKKNRKYFYKRT